MSNTDAPAQAAVTEPSRRPGGVHRPGRKRWLVGGIVVVMIGGAAAGIVITNPFKTPSPPGTGLSSNTYPTAFATIVQRSLVSQTQVSATLGNGGSYTVVNQMQGTFTQLPGAGRIVRQGQVLYHVSGNPVILLYGSVPAYRTLSDGMTGADVKELNAALVALGYASSAQLDPNSDVFTLETAYALEQLQSHLDVPVTGELTLGQAVFLPAAIQVSALGSGIVLGGSAQPGGNVLTATSTTPVVTIDLNAGQQSNVKVGDRVTITLPNNQPTPGVVSSVGTVATTPAGSTASPTITVLVTPTDPKAVAGLTSAPVNVAITTASASNVLVVPVTALLAQPGGGYAVEVTGAAGARHLVTVTPGMFDDAEGLVSVTGPGLVAGQRVVVPGT
jgi:Putative peptidoglycan binding domain